MRVLEERPEAPKCTQNLAKNDATLGRSHVSWFAGQLVEILPTDRVAALEILARATEIVEKYS